MFNAVGNNSEASLNAIIAITESDMQKVNNIILQMAQSRTELIEEISNYLSQAGGKRIRPMLTLASAALFSQGRRESAVKLATAVEFMHSATLLHDDVVDESELRRGKAAARSIWGNQASVLVGDFLLGQAFTLMVESGSMEALAILSKAASIIAEGEVMQLVAVKKLETSKEAYFAIIKAKTAALFCASTQVGAIIANAPKDDIQALKIYGQNLGIAFQLVDDILDYNGAIKDLGKNIGDDFREGKITLPVLLCIEKATMEEKDFWYKALCDQQNSELDFKRALSLLDKYNSLHEATILATNYGKKAKEALLNIKSCVDGKILQALLNVVDFCIKRVN